MKTYFILIVGLISVSISIFAATTGAQTKPEILTNAKVVELVKMGLSEALIVAKINKSVCQCDTSTPSIGKLKLAKVPDAVILAMVNAAEEPKGEPKQQFSDTVINVQNKTAPKVVETPPAPTSAGPTAMKEITEPGIYLFEDGKMTAIEASVFGGGKINPLMTTLTYGIKKAKWRAKVRGRAANLQTSNPQPVFYFVFNRDYKNSGATMPATCGWACPQPHQTNS